MSCQLILLVAVEDVVFAYQTSGGIYLCGMASHSREYQLLERKRVDDVYDRIIFDFKE